MNNIFGATVPKAAVCYTQNVIRENCDFIVIRLLIRIDTHSHSTILCVIVVMVRPVNRLEFVIDNAEYSEW